MLNLDYKVMLLVLFGGGLFSLLFSNILARLIFRRELSDFCEGRDSNYKHHVHLCLNTKPFHSAELNEILECFENRLNELNFMWRKKNSVYCSFKVLNFRWRIKCIVRKKEVSDDSMILEFNYYDRFLNPIMTDIIKQKYERKMKQLNSKMALACM